MNGDVPNTTSNQCPYCGRENGEHNEVCITVELGNVRHIMDRQAVAQESLHRCNVEMREERDRLRYLLNGARAYVHSFAEMTKHPTARVDAMKLIERIDGLRPLSGERTSPDETTALRFPRWTTRNSEDDWTIDPTYLRQVAKAARNLGAQFSIEMEQVEQVALAIEQHLPSKTPSSKERSHG